MPKKNVKVMNQTRDDQEAAEGKDTIKVDAPTERFQATQQVPDASLDAHVTPETVPSPYLKKRMDSASSVVKQDVAAKVVNLGVASGATPDTVAGFRNVSFSGNEGRIAGSMASTPMVGSSSRSGDRFGKKIDAITKHIDYVPCEQIVVDSDGSKPLAEQAGEVQGYNGTIRNENALSQKNNGAVPGSLTYERSLDEIDVDMLYFGRGQTVKQSGVNYNDVPVMTVCTTTNFEGFEAGKTQVFDAHGGVDSSYKQMKAEDYIGRYIPSNIVRGNFVPKALHLQIENKQITQFYFDVDDISTTVYRDQVANKAAIHELNHVNRCELARQRIDAEAGEEVTNQYWSPLARAVAEPSQTVAYLDDIEAHVGNEVFMAYKKATASLAYQINATAKNGMHPHRNLTQALLGCILPEHSSAIYAGLDPFDQKWNVRGGMGLMIAMDDATPKYTTLGKLLSMPLGPKHFLQIADNFMNVLRVDAKYAGMVNSSELFSTIDHDYDPTAPVFATDKSAVVDVYDWNKLFSFKKLTDDGTPMLSNPEFAYCWSDVRNNYQVTVHDPLTYGIYLYLKSKIEGLLNATIGRVKDRDRKVDIVIPIVHSTKYLSTWSFLVCAATRFIIEVRNNALLDIIRIQSNFSYPFTDLITIKDANPMNNANYANTDYQSALVSKTMLPSGLVRLCWPEMWTPLTEDTTHEMTMAPWYMSEAEFKTDGVSDDVLATVWRVNDDAAVMSYPTIRSGVRSSYADIIFAMSERDIRLCLDRIVDLGVESGVGYTSYKYDLTSDGIPVFDMKNLGWTMNSYLALPRELGLSILAPAGYLTGEVMQSDATTYSAITNDIIAALKAAEPDLSVYHLDTLTQNHRLYTSFRATYFFTAKSTGQDVTQNQILSKTDMSVSRATSFMQNWNSIPAIPTYGSLLTDGGFRMSIAECFDPSTKAPIANVSSFAPYAVGSTISGKHMNELISLQKAFWLRVQKLPFALSPWDSSAAAKHAGKKDAGCVDIFDFLYIFGFQGMRASDYREDEYNKQNAVMALGLNCITDPFVEDSPLEKDAQKYTHLGDNAITTH